MRSISHIACISSCAFILAASSCNKKNSPTSEPPPVETKEWKAVLGGNEYEEGNTIHKLTNGGYIIVGSTSSNNNGDVGATKGGYDIWMICMDADGKKVWQKTIGGDNGEKINAIVSNADGTFIAAGSTASNGTGDIGATRGGNDILLIKLDANGNILWNKTYGGSSSEYALGITGTADGKYLITGQTFSNNSGDMGASKGSGDCYVAKISAAGNLEWLKMFGGDGSDEGCRIISNTDGSIVVAGNTNSNTNSDLGPTKGDYDIFFLKLDASGNKQAVKTYGGDQAEYTYNMVPAVDGGFILAGNTYSNNNGDVGTNKGSGDAWIVKIEDNGNLKWQKTIGGSGFEWLHSIAKAPDGGYVAAITTSSNNSGDMGANKGRYDVAITKISAAGVVGTVKMFGGENEDELYSIINGSDGGYISTGYSYSSGGDIGKSNGRSDLVILKFKEL